MCGPFVLTQVMADADGSSPAVTANGVDWAAPASRPIIWAGSTYTALGAIAGACHGALRLDTGFAWLSGTMWHSPRS